MISCLKAKKDEGNDQNFIKNGGVLLEEQVALFNGRSNPIRHFSEKELLIATDYYDKRKMFLVDSDYEMYRGSLKDVPIIVKQHGKYNWGSRHKDIAIGSQMSVHKNVLKVLGCCLETEYPAVVYEFAGTESLFSRISATNDQSLPWKSRLKIAVDLANAITYLHTAFSRPIIHRDIRCSHILLDQNNIPKLPDFGLCISIPEGKSHVEDVHVGTFGFAAPECMATGYLTEKADVYSFGMLLLQLLSVKYFHGKLDIPEIQELCLKKLINAVDQRITEEGIAVEQLLDFGTLVLRCLSHDGEERPTMMEVAKELRRIHQSFPSPC